MAYNEQAYGIVSQVGQVALERQSTQRKKSNTIVTAIGAVITSVLAGLAFLMESGVEWLPEWAPLLVTVLGFVGTVFGVSKTKNGLTESSLKQINDVINDLVDSRQGDQSTPRMPDPVAPVTEISERTRTSTEAIARELDALAKKIGRQG